MPTKRRVKSRAGRGKRPRKPHWIYDVEKAVGLNHADIARLLAPVHFTAAAIRDICNGQSNTPALQGLEFPFDAAYVSDIIAGESKQAAIKAEFSLWLQLGVRWNEYSEAGEILGFDRRPFGRDSLRRFLADLEQFQTEARQPGGAFRILPPNRSTPQFSDDREIN